MEDDILNDISNTMEDANDFRTYVSFKLDMEGVSTKTSNSEFGNPDKEQILDTEAINNVLLFLVNEQGAVLGYDEKDADYADARILTKVMAGTFRVVAVVNASQATENTLKSCTTLSAIKSTPLTKDDMDALVKVGEKTFTFAEMDITGVLETPSNYDPSKYAGKPYPTAFPKITVMQRTARIEIKKLTFFYGEGSTYPVTLESVALINQNLAGMVEGLAVNPVFGEQTININQTLDSNGEFSTAAEKFFYTFANEDEKETSLVLNFKMNGKSKPRTIAIKHPGSPDEALVKAGYLYRLTMNIKVESGDILVSVTGDVQDWEDNTIVLDDIYAE